MFDTKLRALLHVPLEKMGKELGRTPLKAHHLTSLGLFCAFIAAFLIMNGYFIVALLFVFFNRLFDGLDGALARSKGATKAGAFYDIMADFIFYGLIPLSFAYHSPQNSFASSALLFAFYINGAAFLSFASLTSDETEHKGFYYLSGLTEGFETVLFFTLFCLFPSNYSILAFIFALLCIISATSRLVFGLMALK